MLIIEDQRGDGQRAAGQTAGLEAVARDGVAEALLVATTTKHEEVGSNTGTLCAHWLLDRGWSAGSGRPVRLKEWTARVG